MSPVHAEKFQELIRLCEEAKQKGVQMVAIAQPWVLGDTHAEVMTNLGLLANAGLLLRAVQPNDPATK